MIHPHVSTSLKYLGEQLQDNKFETTAWFAEILTKWFNIMSSRSSSQISLSLKNMDKYKETISFLKEFMFIVEHLNVDKSWKPFQHGLLISTKSAVEISKFLLEEKRYDFVLLGRFTQDCIENLFSRIRQTQCKPNALQFKNALKNLFIMQFMANVSKGNYNDDKGEHLTVFF